MSNEQWIFKPELWRLVKASIPRNKAHVHLKDRMQVLKGGKLVPDTLDIYRFLDGTQPLTYEIAEGLGRAFGTSADFFLSLESAMRPITIESVVVS